ncbi:MULTISPECIES: hypothetical protein [unclassified Novosphingobium]|uniref:hypothetical protein n=1 Tax=unclassified Novosphingobium TaxID=2644732 RepID=UPI00146C9177|nr:MULTISPECIES: hypothetical protein [unclassified Novosphingobium]NMN04460.1 hypothetical protein [Novosphingobium sp. SG919]NMN85548.1 hypothetical protein [Novosphingobium sp. SG916]
MEIRGLQRQSKGGRGRDWGLRLAGLAALATVPLLAQGLRHVELAEHGHPGPLALLVALLMVLALWAGFGLGLGGAGLFRLQPLPPRAWLPVSRKAMSRKDSAQ